MFFRSVDQSSLEANQGELSLVRGEIHNINLYKEFK